jgi:UDP-2,3-diacylglucosamine pyrophosphatase LpxH
VKRIIVSDIHIGSRKYNADALISLLLREEYDELILAGDIIDFIKVPSFTESFIKIIEAIDFSKNIIYVVGNHETSLRRLIGNSIYGLKFVEKYEFEDGGRLIRVEHGDRYDSGIVKADFLMKMISIIHDWIERKLDKDLASWWVNYKLKKRKLRRIWDILKWNDDVDVIIMGHSHHPEAIIWVDDKQRIKTYVNCGDWVSHKTWVSISDGVVRLKSEE